MSLNKSSHERVGGVFPEFSWPGILNHQSVTKQDDSVSEMDRFGNVVGHHDDRLAKTPEDVAEFVLQFDTNERIECAERFIEQECGRIKEERPDERDSLTLAAREFARQTIEQIVRQPGECGEFIESTGHPFLCPAQRSGQEADVATGRQVGEKPAVLNDITDAMAYALKCIACNHFAFKSDAALLRC